MKQQIKKDWKSVLFLNLCGDRWQDPFFIDFGAIWASILDASGVQNQKKRGNKQH